VRWGPSLPTLPTTGVTLPTSLRALPHFLACRRVGVPVRDRT